MNRYVRTGLHVDLLDGKRVLYLGPTLHEARHALAELVDDLDPAGVARVVRASGAEAIEHRSGGRVRFSSVGASLRGQSPNVVVVDGDLPSRQTWELNVLLEAGAELVRL